MANAIDIVVNATDRASSKINKIGGAFDSLQKKAQKASGAITAIGAIGGAGLFAVAKAGIDMNSTLETSDARWTTLLKSSEEAEKQMAWMKKFSKQTPFNYKDVDATATALMGMGLGLEDVNKWLPALGDASSVLGGGSETVKGLGMALGQMNAKGKVSAEEMQQLAERGVNAWQMLADGMGMTQGEVRKLSEDGKLLAKDALPLIYEGMQKTFGGGTENLMKSTTGQAMLARENFNWLAQTLTSGAFDWFGANVLPMINKGLMALTSTFEGGLLAGFQKLWNSGTKAKVVMVALASVFGGALIGGLVLVGSAFASAVVAMAPFIATAGVIIGLAYLIYDNWGILAPYFQTLWNSIVNGFNSAKAILSAGWTWLVNLWNTYKPTVIEWLKLAFQGLLTAYNVVKTGLANGWTWLVTTWNNVKPTVFDGLKSTWSFLVEAFDRTKTALSDGWTWLVGVWNDNKPAIFDLLQQYWTNLQTVWGALASVLVAGWNFLVDAWTSKGESVKGLFSGIKTVWDTLKTAFEIALPIIVSVLDMILSNIQILWTNAGPILESFKSLWDTLKNAFMAILPIIQTVAQIVGVVLFTAFTIAIGVINGVILAIGPLIQAVVNVIQFIINLGISVIKVFQGDFKGAFDYAKLAFGNLMDAIGNIITAIIQFFVGFAKGVWSIIRPFASDMWDKFKEMMSNIWNSITEGVGNILTSIGDWVVNMVTKAQDLKTKFDNKMIELMTSALTAIVEGVAKLLQKIGKFVTDMVDKGQKLKSDFKAKMVEVMLGAVTAISEGISDMITEAGSWVKEFVTSGGELIGGFIKGVTGKAKDLVGAVSGVLSKARDLLPFSPAKKGPLSDLDKSGESFFPTWYRGALKNSNSMVSVLTKQFKRVAPEKIIKDNKKLFQFSNTSPLAKYFNAIIEDGDYMNDWITHLPDSMRESLMKVGKEFSQLEGLSVFTGGKQKVVVTHEHQHSGKVTVEGDNSTEEVNFVRDSVQGTSEETFMSDFRQTVRSRK